MKRIIDILLSICAFIILLPVFLLIAVVLKVTSKGPVFHISSRVGKENFHFDMIKFRTMKVDAPQVATHLLKEPKLLLTPIGGFLRKTSLDELPQLINVIKGEMSIVGPRPALFNQYDQIKLRTDSGCHVLMPGITGWAQINGRDDISIKEKVELDTWYYENQSLMLDFKIMFLTAWQIPFRKNVVH